MKILEQSIKQTSVKRLHPHPRNYNTGDVGAIFKSIEANGFFGVVVAQKSTGHILVGNHRYRAALDAGLDKIPVAWVDVSDEEALRILLADNRTAALAVRDEELISNLLLELQQTDIGIEGTGYDDGDLKALLKQLGVDNADAKSVTVAEPKIALAEQLQEKWQVKPGDLYRAGNLAVICGDSLHTKSYARLLGNEKIGLLATDPPYGVSYLKSYETYEEARATNKRTDGLKVPNDDLTGAELDAFLKAWLVAVDQYLAPGTSFYICHADAQGHAFRNAVVNAKLHLAQCLVWVKDNFVMGRQDYHWRHEPILYGWKKGSAHNWNSDRKQDTVWEIPRPNRSEEHPTMKPIELYERMIINSLPDGGIVLDPFGGSGTCLLAAHKLGVRAAAIELDPKFVAVILERLTDSGLTVEKETP